MEAIKTYNDNFQHDGFYQVQNGVLKHHDLKEIEEVQRNCKITHDFRNEAKNTRTQIFEVEKFKRYTLITKQNGEIIKILTAQNPLSLILFNYK